MLDFESSDEGSIPSPGAKHFPTWPNLAKATVLEIVDCEFESRRRDQFQYHVGVAKLVDARVLRASGAKTHCRSNPTFGTILTSSRIPNAGVMQCGRHAGL